MGKGSADYEHYIPDVKEVPDFAKYLKFNLVRSLSELKKLLDAEVKYMAWDTETSSLSPEVGEIVGFSFAFSATEGWYVPICHLTNNIEDDLEVPFNVVADRLPDVGETYRKVYPKVALKALVLFYLKIKQVMNFVYNMRFDFRMMEYAGFSMDSVKYYDVAVGCFLADTNYKLPGLKEMERKFLGWKADTFSEALGDAANYKYVDPEEGYQYPCVDAIGTFAVANKTVRFFQEAKLAGRLENETLYPIMRFEDNPLKIDVDYLNSMAEKTFRSLHELEQKIYHIVGYQIKLGSSKQLGDALQQMGINTGHYTKTGAMKVDIKTLEALNIKSNGEYELLDIYCEWSRKNKLYNSYITTLRDQAVAHGNKLRFSYLTNNVPTGRLSCGSDKKNPYFAHINVQSIPKPHPLDWYVHDYHGEEVDPEDVVILDWRFSKKEKSNRIIEGFNPEGNLRNSFIVDDGCYWISCDYSAQELRVIANLTKEPSWVSTFLSGGDLHKQMAINMWGVENYDKEKRKRAKVLNFGMAYGMSGYSLAEKFNVSVEEGDEIVDRFWKAAPRIKQYQNVCVKKARKEGTVYNYFGLPRRVKFYLNSSDPKKRAFGCRTVNNTVIQSMGACILKVAILKLWKELLNSEDWRSQGVRFLTTVHDEINVQAPKEKTREVIAIMRKCMYMEIPGWEVPIDVGIEIGDRWGRTFPFHYEGDQLVPSWDIVE